LGEEDEGGWRAEGEGQEVAGVVVQLEAEDLTGVDTSKGGLWGGVE
jgi:hypothetical protein